MKPDGFWAGAPGSPWSTRGGDDEAKLHQALYDASVWCVAGLVLAAFVRRR